MYYDAFKKTEISEARLAELGLAGADRERLAELGFFELEIIRPDGGHDPARQGLRPAGEPRRDAADPLRFTRRLELYDFLDELKREKKEALALMRWSRQGMGLISDDGHVFSTAPEDAARLSAAVQNLKNLRDLDAALELEVDFKTGDGSWLRLPLARLEVLAAKMALYTQGCYSRERVLAGAIDAARSLEELNAIDLDSGWPPNAPESPGQDAEAVESARQAALAARKADALLELEREWRNAEGNGILRSSLGFPINASERAKRDLDGLITLLENSTEKETVFCDAGNVFHNIDLDGLRTLRMELIGFGRKLYGLKWSKRERIEAASTMEELEAVNPAFTAEPDAENAEGGLNDALEE